MRFIEEFFAVVFFVTVLSFIFTQVGFHFIDVWTLRSSPILSTDIYCSVHDTLNVGGPSAQWYGETCV